MIKKVPQERRAAENLEVYSSECKGRNLAGDEVFDVPVDMTIEVSHSRTYDSAPTFVNVSCPYNTGSHGQRCIAGHPHKEKVEGQDVLCPYAFDLPFASDFLRKHRDLLANNDLSDIAADRDSALNGYRHLFK